MGSVRSLNLIRTCIKELHPSITRLIRLEELDLWNCENLIALPYNIYELHNLKTLCAAGCSKLATFPKIPVKMDSLRQLYLGGSDIRELDESIENLIGLEELDLSDCKNLTTLPCSIYGLQNLKRFDLTNCSKLVRFPTNTKILNVNGCTLSLPKLVLFSIGGCWETLDWLNLSRNNFVSLPACLTKFVNLEWLGLNGCKRLREIPELPPRVHLNRRGCESLDWKFPNPGATWLSLSSEPIHPKRHRSAEEPSLAESSCPSLSLSTEPTPVNPPKRQRTAAGGQASIVPMFPDLHSAYHSTTTPQLQHQDEPTELSWLSLNSSEPTKPRGPVKGDQDQWLSLSVLPTLPSTSEL